MPRQHDLVRRGAADRNPLRGLDFENIDEAAREAGEQVHEFITQLRDGVIEWIKETTGIDLSGIAEFSDAIFEALAAGLNLSEGGAAVLALLEGLITLDPRSFLDQLAGLFNGDAGLELPDIFTGLGEMFGGLRPDGGFDAGKLFGQLPAGIMSVIRGFIAALGGGNVELGQIIRAVAGGERNWVQPFDSPESMEEDENWKFDPAVGRTKPGSAKCILDGHEHVQTSDAIDAAPGQPLDIGAKLRWDNYTGSGAAFVLRVLAFNAGDQVVGSQQIGSVTPSGANAPNFEAGMSATWTPPAGTSYVRLRMECLASATGGTVHWDDLWLRKPAQSLPQEWINGLVSALSSLGDGITDAWNFVQNVIDKFMNGRGILGSLFSLSHFETEVAKVFGPGSNIPKNLVDGLDDALDIVTATANAAEDAAQGVKDAIREAAELGAGAGAALADVLAGIGKILDLGTWGKRGAVAAQTQVMEIVTAEAPRKYFDSFQGSSGATLPAPWTTPNGGIQFKSSEEIGVASSAGLGWYLSYVTGVFPSGAIGSPVVNMEASVVVGSRDYGGITWYGVPNSPTIIAVRMYASTVNGNPGFAGIGVRYGGTVSEGAGYLQLGRWSLETGAKAVTWTTDAQYAYTATVGDKIGVRVIEDVATVHLNGNAVASRQSSDYTTWGGLGALSGVLMSKTLAPGSPTAAYSDLIDSFATNTIAGTGGAGFKVFKASTTVNSNRFDTISRMSTDAELPFSWQSTGSVKILTEGWWQFQAFFYAGSSSNFGGNTALILVNGEIYRPVPNVNNPQYTAVSALAYVPAGATVQATVAGGTQNGGGPLTGADTSYLVGALVSKA